jgi:hypothetical protein
VEKEQAVLHTALLVEYCPSDLIAWHQNGAATWLSPLGAGRARIRSWKESFAQKKVTICAGFGDLNLK